MYEFTVPGVHSWSRNRARVVEGKPAFYRDRETQEYIDMVSILARSAIRYPIVGIYCVDAVVHTPDRRNRDLDRVLSCIMDGLTHSGKCPDDRMCWQMSIRRQIAEDAPRVDVRVGAIGEGERE